MSRSIKQGKLLPNDGSSLGIITPSQDLILSQELLKNWQGRINNYQSKLLKGVSIDQQGSLFKEIERTAIENFNPLTLSPLPLSFWRWPEAPFHGPAIYLVMDQLEDFNSHLLLYIGETIAADRRWKGEHDCKAYLAAYSEALGIAGLQSQLSIRFWSDVPENTRSRKKLEQQLIRRWLPPFNKETRTRWSTPFTAGIN